MINRDFYINMVYNMWTLPFGNRCLLFIFPPIKNKEGLGKNLYPPVDDDDIISQKTLYKLICKDYDFHDVYFRRCEEFLDGENFEALDNDLRKLLINHFTAVSYFMPKTIIFKILDKLNEKVLFE